jgi:carbonic anhydrase
MRVAVKIYRELGFCEAPACYLAPLEGAIYLALDLRHRSEKDVREKNLSHLFDFNRVWSNQMQTLDPAYFKKRSDIQEPHYLWIGCSDSRVPANQIVGLLPPGEVFVHRNVANVVVHTDLNCLSIMQYAIDVLHVRHIMVVGHYGCGGVRSALNGDRVGLVDIWLRHVQDAWRRGQAITIYAWIYSLKDGLVRDLGMTIHRPEDLLPHYKAALADSDCALPGHPA